MIAWSWRQNKTASVGEMFHEYLAHRSAHPGYEKLDLFSPARARRLGKRLSRIDPSDDSWSVHRTLLPVACNKDLGSSVIAARSILNSALNLCRSAIAPFTGGPGHLRALTAQFQFG